MSKDYKDVRVIHASLEVFDTDAQLKHDMNKILDLRPHLIAGTESGSGSRRVLLEEILEDRGYRPYVPVGTDGWTAVHRTFASPSHFQHRYREVIPSAAERPHGRHRHTAKGVVESSIWHESLGQIGLLTSHYLTHGRHKGDGQDDDPRCRIDHQGENKRLAHELFEAAARHSMGDGISFVTADTNMRDQVADVFFGAPLTTCWDELGKYPGTLEDSTTAMDIVATMDSDGRVKCRSAEAFDDREFFLHGNHHLVVTEYRIQKIRKA